MAQQIRELLVFMDDACPIRANGLRQRRRAAQLDLKLLAAMSLPLLLLAPLSVAGEASQEHPLCAECPQMAVVPAGSFLMGSPAGESLRFDDEGPVHRVTIAQPFAVAIHEVTFAEWDACVAAGGCNGYRPDDEDWGRGNRPVINVSWEDAQAYVTWLSQRIGQPYRLLSEAEWEYVARAGTTTPFSFGATISTDWANYDGNATYGGGSKGVFRRQTVAVGTFPPNGFGLFDVHGNVWEWVQDCWHDGYQDAPDDGSPWESGDCGRRVVRGGSWYHNPNYVRSATRSWDMTDSRDNRIGFRVALTLERLAPTGVAPLPREQ